MSVNWYFKPHKSWTNYPSLDVYYVIVRKIYEDELFILCKMFVILEAIRSIFKCKIFIM